MEDQKGSYGTVTFAPLEETGKSGQVDGFHLDGSRKDSLIKEPDLRQGVTIPWITVQELAMRNLPKRFLFSLFALFVYLLCYIFFFWYSRGWDWVDSIYFAITTLDTVGYGDLRPETGAEKAFCVIMTFISVSFIAAVVGMVLDDFISTAIDPEWRSPSKLFVAGELVIALFFIVLVGAVPYSYIEQQPFSEAVYWASISITTVGYGDACPKTRPGRLFAAMYIFVGTLLTARALGKLVSLPIQLTRHRLEETVEHQFGDCLSPKQYRSISKKVKALNIARSDPNAVTHAEFTLAMLISLGRITEEDIQECTESFALLDSSHTGILREPESKLPDSPD